MTTPSAGALDRAVAAFRQAHGRSPSLVARDPGRVNLMGDHVDYLGGTVLPMAIHLGTTITGEPGGPQVVLESGLEADPVQVGLDVADPAAVTPDWGRYVAGVVAEMGPAAGFTGTVTSDLPVGAGLSSSAALEIAVALALGFDGTPTELALLTQRAEQRASGVPSGVMDQLCIAAADEGSALLIDCGTLEHGPVPLPEDLDVVVIDSGQQRTLDGSGYATRRREVEAALRGLDDGPVVGWLDRIDPAEAEAIGDPIARRRARHALSEHRRTAAFAAALAADDRAALGEIIAASHRSLRDDYEVSTPTVDELVERIGAVDGVWGCRMTGGGFGGCVVALSEPGVLSEGWRVRPAPGAAVLGS
ncbi:MAG: galactokinase [Actinomycetota bacterium]